MKNRSVAAAGDSEKRTESWAFSASGISPQFTVAELDPVISVDDFRMRTAVFAPHPHAGFSAITYLLEDSEGEFVSRDSKGGNIVAKPGGVIWNVAGSGLIHDEYPKVEGELSHGLQIFINLSSTQKQCEPSVLFVDGDEMPVYSENGATVRVITGTAGNVQAKIQPPENITFLDIKLTPGSSFEKTLPNDENVLLFVISGSVLVGDERKELKPFQTATLNFDGENILLSASENAQVILIAGKPHHEPLVFHGPFIMNTKEQVYDAIKRYQSGKMGHLDTADKY